MPPESINLVALVSLSSVVPVSGVIESLRSEGEGALSLENAEGIPSSPEVVGYFCGSPQGQQVSEKESGNLFGSMAYNGYDPVGRPQFSRHISFVDG